MSMPGGNHAWLAYVGVEDITASTAKAKSLGATICMEPQEITNIGRCFSRRSRKSGARQHSPSVAPHQLFEIETARSASLQAWSKP